MRPLEVLAHVVRGHATQRGFDAIAVPSLHSGLAAVILEAGAGRPTHGRQAVLSVVSQGGVLPPIVRVIWFPLASYQYVLPFQLLTVCGRTLLAPEDG